VKPSSIQTRDATDHFLDRPAETGQPNGRAIRAIAMRPGAVDDKERVSGRTPRDSVPSNARAAG